MDLTKNDFSIWWFFSPQNWKTKSLHSGRSLRSLQEGRLGAAPGARTEATSVAKAQRNGAGHRRNPSLGREIEAPKKVKDLILLDVVRGTSVLLTCFYWITWTDGRIQRAHVQSPIWVEETDVFVFKLNKEFH